MRIILSVEGAKGFHCASKWLVVKPFCLSTDNIICDLQLLLIIITTVHCKPVIWGSLSWPPHHQRSPSTHKHWTFSIYLLWRKSAHAQMHTPETDWFTSSKCMRHMLTLYTHVFLLHTLITYQSANYRLFPHPRNTLLTNIAYTDCLDILVVITITIKYSFKKYHNTNCHCTIKWKKNMAKIPYGLIKSLVHHEWWWW